MCKLWGLTTDGPPNLERRYRAPVDIFIKNDALLCRTHRKGILRASMGHSENIASSFVLTEPDFPLYSFAATDNDVVSESAIGYDIHMPSMVG